jgi:MoaA/NifB/PqqE/SkfB family radical SAM enzyme
MNKNNKSFCYEIFKNISIWSHSDKIKYNPCSFYRGHIHETDKIDLADVWHSDAHKKLMDQSARGEHIPGCQACYDEESIGLNSRRLGSYQLYESFHNNTDLMQQGPTSIDYSVGNLCNLKCMICGPNNSTSWISDWSKLNPHQNTAQYRYDKNEVKLLGESKYVNNIKNIHFHGGGDPLLSDFHVKLLQTVREVRGLSDVRVFYNINGTQRVTQQVLDIWSECRLVELYFSIDDVGARFEYQRTGAQWQQVQDNINWFKQYMPVNHLFNVNCVWSYLNIYYLDELYDWYKANLSTNRLGDTTNLIFQRAIGKFNIQSISNKIRDILLDKFKDYPEISQLVKSIPIDKNSHPIFWDYVNRLDSIRGQSFKKLCPEWARLLNEDFM